jgi:hypothetical protein
MVSLGIRRQEGETWKDAARRIARVQGLEHEVMDIYEHEIARGSSEEEAAWTACYEWDVCDIMGDD